MQRTRSSRRRDTKPAGVVVLSGLITLTAVGVLLWVGLRAPSGLPLKSYRTVYVSFADSGNLQPRNQVRIRGVRVGQVISVRPRAGRSIVRLQLDPSVRPLSADTGVALRAQGLLGARYVELRPGRSAARLSDGATLIAPASALTSGVPEALATFDRQTRGALGEDLRELGTGLMGRGDELQQTLRVGPRPAREFPQVIDALLDRGTAVRDLAPSLREGASALDGSRQDIARGIVAADDAAAPFADRAERLEATLRQLPATVNAARQGLRSGRVLLGATQRLANAAARTLPAAPAGLRETVALLRTSREPLRRADVLLRAASPTVPAALSLLRRVSPVLGPVDDAIRHLTPLAGTLGAYGCDIDNFAENWRSTLGLGVEEPGGGTELPSGRIGSLNGFRITVLAGPQLVHDIDTGTKDVLAERVPYPAPCSSSPGTTYSVVPNLLGGSR